jgi:hypothetical protein
MACTVTPFGSLHVDAGLMAVRDTARTQLVSGGGHLRNVRAIR